MNMPLDFVEEEKYSFLKAIANPVEYKKARGSQSLTNIPLVIGIIATGLLTGGGFIYTFMMKAALDEPSTTYAVLSAIMKSAVPYYIIINTLMELLVIPFIIFLNWNTNPTRRNYIIIGFATYFVLRIWTYLVFAETRLEISQRTLSAADIEWFKQTLATDYRVILDLFTQVFFILAARVPIKKVVGDGRQPEDKRQDTIIK